MAIYLEKRTHADLARLFAEEQNRDPFDMEAFQAEVQRVRDSGIARDLGEINPDLYCYAVPVHYQGRAVARLELFMQQSQECFSR